MSASLVTPIIRWGWLWITFIVLLAYWPLTTFQFGLNEGDTLDCWLPWRHFIESSLKEGRFPTWNPLQQMGYPIHADLQGPAWYPEALILGGTIGLGPHVLQLLFLAYVIIGGCGMRMLTRKMIGNDQAALFIGSAYALSGFFTAHTMHFYSVISGAWLPWALWSFLVLLDRATLRNALVVALFLFLLLTGGNHTFLIIIAYPVTALFLVELWKAWQRGDKGHLRAMAGTAIVAVLVALIMAFGTVHAVWEVTPFIERIQGLELEKAQMSPFTFSALKTLIWPAVAAGDADVLGTDPPMGNGYFGAIMLIFAMIGAAYIRGYRMWVLFGFALICALVSFGAALPFHAVLWRFVPGMDLFRFPGYFWYFTMLGLLPVAGLGIIKVLAGGGKRALVALAVGLVLLTGAMMIRNGWAGLGDGNMPLLEWMRAMLLSSKMVINGAFQILVLAALLVWIFKGEQKVWILGALVVIEMIIGIQFTQWNTTLGRHTPAELAERIDALPTGPVVPALRPLGSNTDDSQVMHQLWRNTQNFQGMPTHGGFNSFWLRAHQELEREHPDLHEAMLRQPMIYLANSVHQGERNNVDRISEAPAVLHESSISDDLQLGTGTLEMLSFDHESFRLSAHLSDSGFMVVQQNAYPGWSITVNGAPSQVISVNVAAFGTWLPAGDHEVEIRYHKPILTVLRWISFAAFFGALFFLSWSSSWRYLSLGVTGILMLAWLWPIILHQPKEKRMLAGWRDAAGLLSLEKHVILVNADRPLRGNDVRSHVLRMDVPDEMGPLEAELTELGYPTEFILAWYGLPINAACLALLADHDYAFTKTAGNSDAGVWLLEHDNSTSLNWSVLYQDPLDGGVPLSSPTAPWTKAYRRNIGELIGEGVKELIIDLEFKGNLDGQARLVIERRRNDVITDHETIPLSATEPDDARWRKFYAIRPIPDDRFSMDELGIYVVALGEDTVRVKDMRIRAGDIRKSTIEKFR